MTEGKDTNALELVAAMVAALNEHVIDGQEAYWSDDMVWRGPAGIGTKHGLADFQENHQRPFLHAFPDKRADDQIRFGCGEWAAAAGVQHATHDGDWLGIPATGEQVEVRYMDIWRAEDGRLVENWVLIDILGFLEQLGYNIGNVLRFIGSKQPEFFDRVADPDRQEG